MQCPTQDNSCGKEGLRCTPRVQLKGFYYRNALERIVLKGFIIGMHSKVLYYRNALEKIVLKKCIGKGFAIGVKLKGLH